MAHLTTMRDQSVDRCSAAWRESISCEQKYPVSRNIPRHIQANWFALFVKAIFVIALGVGRCGSPHHQGTGPQTILMCLIRRCTPNSALVDRVDFATRYRCLLDRLPASRLLPPRSGLERSDFVLWPQATEKDVRSNVGYGLLSGLVLLTVSFVGRDPIQPFASANLSMDHSGSANLR